MTPEQKIMSAIIKWYVNDTGNDISRQLTTESVDDIYEG